MELEKQLPRASISRDLPRGRKRAGWKKDFLCSLEAAAVEMGDVSEEEILETIRATRRVPARRKHLKAALTFEEALKLSLKESVVSTSLPHGPSSTRKKLPEITLVASTKTKTA